MAEVKNIFVGAKMNKDLNPRLISNNEYIEARNASIINSEGSDSGMVQNVSGNALLTDFGLTGVNLEIIGFYADTMNNRLFAFITDWNDSSPNNMSNFAAPQSHHYICMYDVQTETGTTLVSGNFLNFSKTHAVLGIDLIEELLFFTDNRNQPRKINVETATSNKDYYSEESDISVAKYYPWKAPRLSKNNSLGKLQPNSLLQQDVILEDTFGGTSPYIIETSQYTVSPAGGSNATFKVYTSEGWVTKVEVVDAGSGYSEGDVISIDPVNGLSPQENPLLCTLTADNFQKESTMLDVTSENLPLTQTLLVDSVPVDSVTEFSTLTPVNSNWVGTILTVKSADGVSQIASDRKIKVTAVGSTSPYSITHTEVSTPIVESDIVTLGANPNYNSAFIGDTNFLSDKFVRFSYRFKYEDNEYSLTAPFTQIAFIPKQDGYFLEDSVPTNINDDDANSDENNAVKSTIINFFENKVNQAEIIIPMPEGVSSVDKLQSKLKVSEIEILYKESDKVAIQSLGFISSSDLEGETGSEYVYKYSSQSPIKTLPEKETTRTSDKVPIRAKAQEITGNRVIYGNYLVRTTRPPELSYTSFISEKSQQGQLNSVNEIEYPNHVLKQNRSYRTGIVLVDKFGRQSDVITSKNSTVYCPYNEATGSFITDEDVYRGSSLKILFNSRIPSELDIPGYAGLYSETNPNGWYSYKVVVQQKEQDYYNVFLPTALNNYPNYDTNVGAISQSTAFITLFSDNVNKVPRDLKEVGAQDLQFSSSANLYGRVFNTTFEDDTPTNSQFIPSTTPDKVVSIGLRDEIGMNRDADGVFYATSPFYSIPSVFRETPEEADTNNTGSNPYIAKVATKKAIGSVGGDLATASTEQVTFKNVRLNVYETEPFNSNLDIFYETSTSGLISELNDQINIGTGDSVPFAISGWSFSLSESDEPESYVTTAPFDILNAQGQSLTLQIAGLPEPNITARILSVKTRGGENIIQSGSSNPVFILEQNTSYRTWSIKTTASQYFTYTWGSVSRGKDVFQFEFEFTNTVLGVEYVSIINQNDLSNSLTNEEPIETTVFYPGGNAYPKQTLPLFAYAIPDNSSQYSLSTLTWVNNTNDKTELSWGRLGKNKNNNNPYTIDQGWIDLHGFNFENGSINPLVSTKKSGLEVEITDVWVWNEFMTPGNAPPNYSKWVSVKFKSYRFEYTVANGPYARRTVVKNVFPMDDLFRLRNNSTTNLNEILQINLKNITHIQKGLQGPGTIQAPLDNATKYKVFMNVKDANQGQGSKQIRTFSVDVSLTNALNLDN